MMVTRTVSYMVLFTMLNLTWGATVSQAQTTQSDSDSYVAGQVKPQGEWLEFRQARYVD